MGAKRVFCTIFYVLFLILFTGLLICNITAFINHFNLMPNDFITTKINSNILEPFNSALTGLNIMDAKLISSILVLSFLAITLVFWFLSLSILINVMRNTPTGGASITAIIFSIVMFLIVDVIIVLQVYGGKTIAEVLQNYYLVASAIVWVLCLLFAIIAITIKAGLEKLEDDENADPELSEALARERRIQQILGEDVDPRI